MDAAKIERSLKAARRLIERCRRHFDSSYELREKDEVLQGISEALDELARWAESRAEAAQRRGE